MGCSPSKENDKSAVGSRSLGQTYDDQAEDAAAMLTTGPLYDRLQLSISCKGLINLDNFSKSDPFVVIKMLSPADGNHPVEIGRTEIISNNLNPNFVTIIPATFKFEEVQTLIFEVYDVDTAYSSADASNINPSQQEFQGSAECALAQVVNGRDQTWEGVLTGAVRGKVHSGSPPKVVVRAERVSNSNSLVDISLGSSQLGKGNAFLRVSRIGESGPPIPCYKTEVIKGSPPKPWKAIKLSLQVLANGDVYRPLLLEVFSWKKNGVHQLLGYTKKSVNDIQEKANMGGGDVPLDGGSGGNITVHGCVLIPQPSFFDYLAGGMQIGFTVAIDYTASNGDPNQIGTLHYHDPAGRLNEYGQSIQSIGGVLEYFDDDRRFPLYGFGGCPNRRPPASHCFAVNMNEEDAEVEGIDGVLGMYRLSLTHVMLSGPTLFAPVISQAAQLAASTVSNDPAQQQYTILLLITDGVICDMENTIEAIVAAADYPFSIVIVGVGTADYKSMEDLDGDDVRLVNRAGKRASRDIVQFVPMRDFKGKSSHALAKEVLAEIPGQVIDYMTSNKIPPADPRRARLQRGGSVGANAIRGSMHHMPLQQQGSFMQPQGSFMQPQGSFMQPQGSFMQPQGSFMQHGPGAPLGPTAPGVNNFGGVSDAPPPYSY